MFRRVCPNALKSALIVSMHVDDLFGTIPNTFLTEKNISLSLFFSRFSLVHDLLLPVFTLNFSKCPLYAFIFFLSRLAVPPMVWIPQQLVGTPVGYNVTLECFIEAYPISLNYWSKDDEPADMIHDSNKYK